MFTALVLVIAALNAALLYALSFLAVGGDGSDEGIILVRIVGFGWIAACTLLALWLARGKRGLLAILAALATWPTGLAMAQVGLVVAMGWEWIKPNSAEFEAACREAATTFVAAPGTPVASIAYDWKELGPPMYNYFTVGSRANVAGLRSGTGTLGYPPAIRFTEQRCCRFEGAPLDGVGPYFRRPAQGPYFGVTEVTADVLVLFETAVAVSYPDGATLVRYDVTVTDRRDGRKLAAMRYFFDERNRRGCVAGGVMDEREFVLKAVGAG